MEVCRPDSQACENEVRVHHGKKQIFKRCKQEHACRNNQIQNPRQAFLPTQCNGDEENDVCRCCCTSHLCNEAERVCSKRCNINKADLAIIMDSSSSVKVKNFNTMRSFVQNLVNAFQVGVGMVHVALIRYIHSTFMFKFLKLTSSNFHILKKVQQKRRCPSYIC